MELDLESDKASESERILFGCFWELKDISKNESKVKGISLHRSLLEHNLIEFTMGAYYYKNYTSLGKVPNSFYHSFSPFQISANIDFYNFVKDLEDKEKRKGVFISNYPIASTFNHLEDSSELKIKYDKLKLRGLLLERESLYQRISEDTINWNKLLSN